MTNWSFVFSETLALYETLVVPGDRGDEAKGQVTAQAGYTIHTMHDATVGYISKSGGQTQYHGIAVDALQDTAGYGADYLTDELQPDGTRIIKLAYSEYAPPAPGAPLPPANWQKPTPEMLTFGGPLVMKSVAPPEPSGPTPPDPMPPMPKYWSKQPRLSLDWYAEAGHSLNDVYLNLLWREADAGGWGNWWYWIIEETWTVQQVSEAIKDSDEYKAIHGSY